MNLRALADLQPSLEVPWGGGCSERVEIENEMENEMKTSINLRGTVYYRMIFVKIRLKSNFSVVRHFLENVKTSEKLS